MVSTIVINRSNIMDYEEVDIVHSLQIDFARAMSLPSLAISFFLFFIIYSASSGLMLLRGLKRGKRYKKVQYLLPHSLLYQVKAV